VKEVVPYKQNLEEGKPLLFHSAVSSGVVYMGRWVKGLLVGRQPGWNLRGTLREIHLLRVPDHRSNLSSTNSWCCIRYGTNLHPYKTVPVPRMKSDLGNPQERRWSEADQNLAFPEAFACSDHRAAEFRQYVLVRPKRLSSVSIPAKTELTGCFSHRFGRGGTVQD
jgi:hypothetical protein